MTDIEAFWPGGARLAVTVSMQFEAGGQPISGAGGPITEPILDGFPDLGQNSFYEYGAREGVPRILDLMDKHRIKMSSFMMVTRYAGIPMLPQRSSIVVTRRALTVDVGNGSTNWTVTPRRGGSSTACGRSRRLPAFARWGTTIIGSGRVSTL
jgi:hypothetical protein